MRFVCKITMRHLHRIVLGLGRQCVMRITDWLPAAEAVLRSWQAVNWSVFPAIYFTGFFHFCFYVVSYGYRVGCIRVIVPVGPPAFYRSFFDIFSCTLHSPRERNIIASWKEKSARFLRTVPFHVPFLLAVFCVDVWLLPVHSCSYRDADSDQSVRYVTFISVSRDQNVVMNSKVQLLCRLVVRHD